MACGSPFKRSSRSLPIIGDQPQQTYSVRSTHGGCCAQPLPSKTGAQARTRPCASVAGGRWQMAGISTTRASRRWCQVSLFSVCWRASALADQGGRRLGRRRVYNYAWACLRWRFGV
ncbi:hypothetical protein C8035_v000997 [Colletotrichum spinosum]|uniref:Uncharacterized protein n=1 Tax=Colletotrichum spinosum TaxID=1347390 RepID=A0A4R8Q561_9PEZI|nr:hypothetical protein C8035_v000997 [Colletotrichum spinosum]